MAGPNTLLLQIWRDVYIFILDFVYSVWCSDLFFYSIPKYSYLVGY